MQGSQMTQLPRQAGISLKPQYFDDLDTLVEGALWFEVHPENYMVDGGPRLRGLLAAAARFPISLHGVGASLGGPDLPSDAHLRALQKLIDLVEPGSISEHATWSMANGEYFAELLPLTRTHESLKQLVRGVNHMQERLGRTILIENPTNYLPVVTEMDEAAFLVEVAARTGCGILLDINNLYLSANNCGIDAMDYISALPRQLVGEVHIAGHAADQNFGQQLLIDSHGAAVAEPVWDLLDRALAHLGPVPVLLERDANLPGFAELQSEAARINRALERVCDNNLPGNTALAAAHD